MTDEPRAPKPSAPRDSSGLEGVVDDVLGFDFKLPRTLRDLIIRPGRVADAALAGDHSRYTRPLRVFLVLLAVQTVVYGWVGVFDSSSLSTMFSNDPVRVAAAEARLAEVGSSLAQADDAVARWTSWSTGPITTLASLISALVIWATRRRLGPFKALQLYLVGTNASTLVALPLLAGGVLTGLQGLLWTSGASYLVYFAYMGLVLHKRAADTATGLALRLLALVATVIPTVIVVSILLLAVVEIGFRMDVGLWRLGLIFDATVDAAQQAQ